MIDVVLNLEDKEQIVDEMLNMLIKEMEQKTPNNLSYNDKCDLLKSLMTIRMPGYLEKDFISLQDKFLSDNNRIKGVEKIENIKFKNQIGVCSGDILRLNADALINVQYKTSNDFNIPFISGSQDIFLNAGLQVKEDLSKLITKQAGVETFGKCYITSAYNLPSKYILHIEILNKEITEMSNIERDLLFNTFKACFDNVKLNNIKVLAIPYVSKNDLIKDMKIKNSFYNLLIAKFKEWQKKAKYKFNILLVTK